MFAFIKLQRCKFSLSKMANNGRIKELTEGIGNNIILPQTCILGNREKSMKIERMTIDNINSLKHSDLTFNEELNNLICGGNGVGKTTILRSINQYFLYDDNNYIKKYYNSEYGEIIVYIMDLENLEV